MGGLISILGAVRGFPKKNEVDMEEVIKASQQSEK